MDQRFFNDQEVTEKMSDDEMEKQMNILEDVVGRAVSKPWKNNEDQIFNMVRYDATQEEQYEQEKHELPKQKTVSKKQKQKVQQQQSKEPVVDTEKYYKVEDKLKDVFSSQSQFSLTSLFHTSDKSSNKLEQDDYEAEKISNPQKKFGRNPFIDDSSDSEDEENVHEDNVDNFDDKVASEKNLGPRGVRREVFFFKIDDSRFKDAEEFYNPIYNKINYTGSYDPRFTKKRYSLRDFLKNKFKRHKRYVGKKRFSRKLGGTHSNQKHHKVTQTKSGNFKNKTKKKTISKSNKKNDS